MPRNTYVRNYTRVKEFIKSNPNAFPNKLLFSRVFINIVAQNTKLSYTTITHYLPELERDGLIKRPSKGYVELLV